MVSNSPDADTLYMSLDMAEATLNRRVPTNEDGYTLLGLDLWVHKNTQYHIATINSSEFKKARDFQ